MNPGNKRKPTANQVIKEFKRRLSGDTTREATRDEVAELKRQNDEIKRELADLYMENKGLKKSLNGYE